MIEITDLQKIGIGLAGFGISFLFLGMLLLFDKGLLAIGNVRAQLHLYLHLHLHLLVNNSNCLFPQILFISGLGCVIGVERTLRFFFQRHKVKGTTAFFGGIVIVLLGFPIIGMIIESYGFFALFSGFFPVAINFLGRVPVLGSLLNLPFLQKVR
ncbi:hypothetical protein M5D96_011887 [Drosophila gunungcola]|uniref:Vesicle transport protein GOT1B n=1 Tax=Drosophila gunungcola TaxID=103775 RepID=A0A9P9YEZ7_9MUSC|nr:hypothetical protein M5D96_011887 [Drosophila gunungcola]